LNLLDGARDLNEAAPRTDLPFTLVDLLIPEAGAFYVMDRAYLDFERLHALSQAVLSL
jgi:hypothetical protein